MQFPQNLAVLRDGDVIQRAGVCSNISPERTVVELRATIFGDNPASTACGVIVRLNDITNFGVRNCAVLDISAVHIRHAVFDDKWRSDLPVYGVDQAKTVCLHQKL